MHILSPRQARRRPLITVVVVALLSASLPARASDEINVSQVLRVMNEYRAAAGVPALRHDSRLELAARDRMRHMEDEAYWSHLSPNGLSPFIWIKARAYQYTAAGENLAAGFETARLLVASWMESKGHRENILSADYADCGIAIIEGSTTHPAPGKSIVVLFGRE
jgi:uncharacterized protein YkwD